MARGNGVLAFLAGLGSGYFTAQDKQKELDRQAKLDQITFDQAARNKQEFDDKEALEQKLQNIPTTQNSTATPVDASGLQSAMPGVFQDSDTAQNFMDNPNATADQKAAVLTDYAKQGLSADNNTQVVAKDGSLDTQDASQTVQRKPWQIMQDKAAVYLGSGKPEYEDGAIKMLQYSQQLKSDDYKQQILAARQQGIDGLLSMMNNHDNSELGITNAQVQYSPDGKTAYLTGNDANGNPLPANDPQRTFDLRNGSVEDQLTSRLLAMSSPDALGAHIIQQVQQARDNRNEDRADKQVGIEQQNADRGDKTLANTIQQQGVENQHWQQSFDQGVSDKKFEHGIQSQEVKIKQNEEQDMHADRMQKMRDAVTEYMFKAGDKYRDNFQAAVGDFDKTFARDPMGNISGTELNSGVYAEALKQIGQRVQQGMSIADATAAGRKFYDTAIALHNAKDPNYLTSAQQQIAGGLTVNPTSPSNPNSASSSAAAAPTGQKDYSHLWNK